MLLNPTQNQINIKKDKLPNYQIYKFLYLLIKSQTQHSNYCRKISNYHRRMLQSLQQSFTQANSLIYRSTSNSHRIINIKGPDKNLELKIMLLSRRPLIRTKKGTISQFVVADQTGSAYMNFFDQFGESLEEGDILYASGVYTSYHKDILIIFQGSQSIIKRIGKWMMKFSTQTNISIGQKKVDQKHESQHQKQK